jgi:hypothetical protein
MKKQKLILFGILEKEKKQNFISSRCPSLLLARPNQSTRMHGPPAPRSLLSLFLLAHFPFSFARPS